MKILITAELPASALDRLRAAGHQLRLEMTWAERRHILSEEAMVRLAQGCEIIIAEMEPVSERVMAATERLCLVACTRANPVNVDLTAATARGIPALYTPGRNARAVADLVLALMVILARHLIQAGVFVREGRWHAEHRW